MKKTLLALAVSGAVVAAPTYAVEAKISGQVNRAMVMQDNGQQKATTFVDNSNSGSRIRLVGSEKAQTVGGGEVEYGVKWEWQHQSNQSNVAQSGQFNDTGNSTMDIRHQVVYVKGNAGKVSLGKTDGAANGTAEVDLSGTGVVAYSDAAADMLSSVGFVNKTGTTVTQVTTVGAQTGQFDGLSRHNVVRYDSPNLGPVVLSASLGNGSSTELAGTYSAELGDGNKLAAALGWSDYGDSLNGVGADGLYDTADDTITDRQRMSGSVSYLANFGLNLTLSYSTQKTDKLNGVVQTDAIGGKNQKYTYFKVGYNMGQHAFSVDYGLRDNDMKSAVSTTRFGDATSTSLAYVYKPISSVDLYASYRVESIDDPKTVDALGNVTATTAVDKVNALILGGRVKF